MDRPLQKISSCSTTPLKTSTYILTFVDNIADKSLCLIPSCFLSSHPFNSGAGQEWAWVYSPYYLHRIYIFFECDFSTSTASVLAGPFLQSFISSYEFSAYFPAYVLFQLQIHSSCKFIQLCPVETCVHKIQTQWDTKIEYIKKIFNSQLIFRKLTLIECQASIGYSNNWSKT